MPALAFADVFVPENFQKITGFGFFVAGEISTQAEALEQHGGTRAVRIPMAEQPDAVIDAMAEFLGRR